MKKLVVFFTSLLLALSLSAIGTIAPVLAESRVLVTVTLDSGYCDAPSFHSWDAAFINWLHSLLSVDAPCEPPEDITRADVYQIAFLTAGSTDVETFYVWHDDLYNLACVTRPDGSVHSVSVDLPKMLHHAVYEDVSFDIVEEHRALLQQHGWTIAFRHPHMLVQLPKKLEASRTDPAALHFTWADLFLRDAGYDITPSLGKAVVPYVYTLYETVPRAAFYRDDSSDVRSTLRAVVLECNGQVIGAYLAAYSWDCSALMSLKGNAAPALLGDTTTSEYLLSRLPITDAEREMAALTPEEVIIRYGEVNDPALMEIGVLLKNLGTASTMIYNPLALTAIPTGSAVQVLRPLDLPGESMYEVATSVGTRFPALVYESPETGWKIESFYNTGF